MRLCCSPGSQDLGVKASLCPGTEHCHVREGRAYELYPEKAVCVCVLTHTQPKIQLYFTLKNHLEILYLKRRILKAFIHTTLYTGKL